MRTPPEFTVVGQHLRKAVVVVDGGDKAAATLGIRGLGGVVVGDSVGRGFGDKLAIGFVIADGKAGALAGGDQVSPRCSCRAAQRCGHA